MAILLKFETEIKGDCNFAEHEDWITLDSCNFSVHRSISNSGGGKSREVSTPNFGEIICGKSSDMATPDIFAQAISGKSLGKAELHWVQTGAGDDGVQVYYKVELMAPIISSFSLDSSGDRPNETFTVSFNEIITQMDDFDGDTKIEGSPKGWNLVDSKPV